MGLRPPRQGASCGTPTRSAVAATRESASRPATPHSLLHSSSAHTLRSEKRRPGLGSGWPGTHQRGPSRSSQRSSPGAAAMLWAPRARVTPRPPAGGAGGGAGAGGVGGGARTAGGGERHVSTGSEQAAQCLGGGRGVPPELLLPWQPPQSPFASPNRRLRFTKDPPRHPVRHYASLHHPNRFFCLPPSASDFWSMLKQPSLFITSSNCRS